jgi:hypothetical protein
MVGAIADWSKLYRQAFDNLKPGGWFEHCELDITRIRGKTPLDDDHIYNQWARNFQEAGQRTGRRFDFAGADMEQWMKEAGFVDVFHTTWTIPIGMWSKNPVWWDIGGFTWVFVDKSLEGFALYILERVLQWKMEDVKKHINDMRSAINRTGLFPRFDL